MIPILQASTWRESETVLRKRKRLIAKAVVICVVLCYTKRVQARFRGGYLLSSVWAFPEHGQNALYSKEKSMARSTYSIRVDEKTRSAFSKKCEEEGIGVSVALETLMKAYIAETIKLKNETHIIMGQKGGDE